MGDGPTNAVCHQAHNGRVQAVDRGQTGELRVGHALRHQQRDEDDAGNEVARQPLALISARGYERRASSAR
jgi:hypothetical protein